MFYERLFMEGKMIMKKLLSVLTIFALLVAVCAGCVPAEENAGNGDVPETTIGTSVEDASAPRKLQEQSTC